MNKKQYQQPCSRILKPKGELVLAEISLVVSDEPYDGDAGAKGGFFYDEEDEPATLQRHIKSVWDE